MTRSISFALNGRNWDNSKSHFRWPFQSALFQSQVYTVIESKESLDGPFDYHCGINWPIFCSFTNTMNIDATIHHDLLGVPNQMLYCKQNSVLDPTTIRYVFFSPTHLWNMKGRDLKTSWWWTGLCKFQRECLATDFGEVKETRSILRMGSAVGRLRQLVVQAGVVFSRFGSSI